MGLQIQDGTGEGFVAEVDHDNRLHVKSITESKEHVINEESGKVWTIAFEDLNPAGTDDYVVYIKNTGDAQLEVQTFRFSCDTAASQVEVHAVTGTVVGGAAVTPVSRNVGSGASPSATIESGTDLTGLTTAGTLALVQCAVVNTQYELYLRTSIVLSKGSAIGILVQTATANLSGFITLVEEGID